LRSSAFFRRILHQLQPQLAVIIIFDACDTSQPTSVSTALDTRQ